MSYLGEHKHPATFHLARVESRGIGPYPMVSPQVVDLLVPTRCPEIFTDELHRVQCISEESTVMA